MAVTERYNLPYPTLSDPANVPNDIKNLVEKLEDVLPDVTGNEIVISPEEPTKEDAKLWIDPEDPLNNVGTEVTNSLDGNEEDMAPCVRAVNEGLGKFGKLLWNGNFIEGSITVPGLSKYTLIAVNVGDCICFGSKYLGFGGFVGYGSYSLSSKGYRFSVENDTLTIDNINKGGSNGTNQEPVKNIWGLF